MSSHKLAVIGSGGVGKTSLIIQYCKQQFIEEYDPTIEDSYRKRICVDGECGMLEIFDTGFVSEFYPQQDQYIRGSEAFICVYSITSNSSFTEIRHLRDRILLIKDADDVPIILVGNKCDLEEERQVTIEAGKNVAQAFDCPFFETSARYATNVDEAFSELVRRVRLKQREVLAGHQQPRK